MNGSGWFPAALPRDLSKRSGGEGENEGEELRRVRRRWQKGSPERIETYLGGAPWRETAQGSPRVSGQWIPYYTGRRTPSSPFDDSYFVLIVPERHMAALYSGSARLRSQDKQVLRIIDLPQPGICICYAKTKRGVRVDLPKRSFFITESDFSGGNPENRASSGATLMQRKLAIG
ncbi:hypothetical protein K0M31_001471 [Melipona bicolor]|uniref:Uncharacterized protein n=1 Tax=Melipona bicolor TaxID=60889 RepID=A0AA40KXN1_9HYME|nr:hypothetical protein K0M31_001471 [Melipona bicolor]